MSSASSAVTYTSVYTDFEPGRVFWGADDEEITDGGIPRVIVYGYDGLPIQPVAPPSPDYIPDSEDPQTPPVPQDEDEHEPMFIQPHDPDYVSEPIYPEYIPLEDEHVFLVEEQPLPLVDSPTAESPGYVTESDPEEDPEEYEDEETEDGQDDYPVDGGDDGDDDDGNSSRDDAMMKAEGEQEAEDTQRCRLRSSRSLSILQASISLPPEAEVERLLAMPTPSPSPPISLSPPSVGERLARCTTPSAHSSPPPVPSPLLPSSGNDIPESEQPPRKRLCLSTLGSRYEGINEVGYGIRELGNRQRQFLNSTYDHDRYGLTAGQLTYGGYDDSPGDSMDCEGGGLCFPRSLGSLDRIESGNPLGAPDPP
ncbi:hypothetical protein Tco_0167309 [Tanacetum coccineum]